MDRELESSYRYRRLGRRAVVGMGAVALVVVVLILFRGGCGLRWRGEQVRTGRWTAGRSRGSWRPRGRWCRRSRG